MTPISVSLPLPLVPGPEGSAGKATTTTTTETEEGAGAGTGTAAPEVIGQQQQQIEEEEEEVVEAALTSSKAGTSLSSSSSKIAMTTAAAVPAPAEMMVIDTAGRIEEGEGGEEDNNTVTATTAATTTTTSTATATATTTTTRSTSGEESERLNGDHTTTTNNNKNISSSTKKQQLISCSCSTITKSTIGLLLLAFLIYVIVDSQTNQNIKSAIRNLLEWIQKNPTSGAFVYMFVSFVTTLVFIPGILMNMGGGYVFAEIYGFGIGIVVGTLLYFVGAALAAFVSFYLGRYLLRNFVLKQLMERPKLKWLQAMDTVLETKGLRIMILLRLSIFRLSPYLNYAVGTMAVSSKQNCLSFVAAIPGTAMFVFFGASADSLASSSDDTTTGTKQSVGRIVGLVLGIVFALVAIGLTMYYTKLELTRMTNTTTIHQQQQQQQHDDGGGGGDDDEQDLEQQQDQDRRNIEDGEEEESISNGTETNCTRDLVTNNE